MRGLRMAIAASVLGLSACGAGEVGAGGSGNGGSGDVAQVPAEVAQLITVDFPADGQVHVQSQGRFSIKPTTLFCEMDASVSPEIRSLGISGVGIDGVKLTEALSALGQDYYLDGSPRQRTVQSGQCSGAGEAAFYRGYAQNNRTGQPYKLILAVWQGDPASGGAVWVGGVERLEAGPRAQISNPFGTDRLPFEIRADATSLSLAFAQDAL
jgi:hypothetical protein